MSLASTSLLPESKVKQARKLASILSAWTVKEDSWTAIDLALANLDEQDSATRSPASKDFEVMCREVVGEDSAPLVIPHLQKKIAARKEELQRKRSDLM